MKRLALALFLAALPMFAQESGVMRGPQADYETEINRTSAVPTTVLIAAAPRGLYEACWYQQILQKATTSSSLQAVISWNNGSAKSTSLASLNGGAMQTTPDTTNTVNSYMTGCHRFGVSDATDISGTVNYSSTGATPLQYLLYITIKRVY